MPLLLSFNRHPYLCHRFGFQGITTPLPVCLYKPLDKPLVLSTSPTTAPPLSRASIWDTAPEAFGDQGYFSPLIDLYPECDSDLEALYDSPADRAPVSYDDLQKPPSNLEADPINSESLHTEDQSDRETVRAIRSYMKWLFIPEHRHVCPSRRENPLIGSWSQPTRKVSVTMPPSSKPPGFKLQELPANRSVRSTSQCKSVNRWSGDTSPLSSSLPGMQSLLRVYLPLPDPYRRKGAKSLQKLPQLNRIGKGKSSQKTKKVLSELTDLSTFQKNVHATYGRYHFCPSLQYDSPAS